MGLAITRSAVSQRLAILRAARLVIDEPRGYFVHYRLSRTRLGQFRDRCGRRSVRSLPNMRICALTQMIQRPKTGYTAKTVAKRESRV